MNASKNDPGQSLESAVAAGEDDDFKDLRSRVVKGMLLYSGARLVLFLVIFGLVLAVTSLAGVEEVPLLVAAILALVISLPMSMFVFRGLRTQISADTAEWDARRADARRRLADELRGR